MIDMFNVSFIQCEHITVHKLVYLDIWTLLQTLFGKSIFAFYLLW